MDLEKDPRQEHQDEVSKDPVFAGFPSDRVIRKAWKQRKRLENQAERARVRDAIHVKMHDPEGLLDLDIERRTSRRLHVARVVKRQWMLHVQKRKIKAELKSTKDLATFIQGMSRSKTLYAMIALGYFRHVLDSAEYREDHRYKLAIRAALEDPILSKVIQRKWESFDREFPDSPDIASW